MIRLRNGRFPAISPASTLSVTPVIPPALVRPEGQLSFTQPRFAAGLLAGLVAWRTRNAALTLVVGLVALVVAEAAGWT